MREIMGSAEYFKNALMLHSLQDRAEAHLLNTACASAYSNNKRKDTIIIIIINTSDRVV